MSPAWTWWAPGVAHFCAKNWPCSRSTSWLHYQGRQTLGPHALSLLFTPGRLCSLQICTACSSSSSSLQWQVCSLMCQEHRFHCVVQLICDPWPGPSPVYCQLSRSGTGKGAIISRDGQGMRKGDQQVVLPNTYRPGHVHKSQWPWKSSHVPAHSGNRMQWAVPWRAPGLTPALIAFPLQYCCPLICSDNSKRPPFCTCWKQYALGLMRTCPSLC